MKRLTFSQFLKENNDTAYFTFGRMNPPTVGHEKLLDKMFEYANKCPYRVYLSHSHDSKKNPLIYEDKIKIARKMFPKHSRHIYNTESVRNILEAASSLYDEGFKKIVMVCGDDRLVEFKERLNAYNGKSGRHGFYVFENIKVISAGMRDPDAQDKSGVSSTKLREAAAEGKFGEFSQGLPKSINTNEARNIYDKVRSGLNTDKIHKYGNTNHIREKYINGELFEVGDNVIIKENSELATVSVLGTNYVIVETTDKKRYRKWLNDIEKIKEGH